MQKLNNNFKIPLRENDIINFLDQRVILKLFKVGNKYDRNILE